MLHALQSWRGYETQQPLICCRCHRRTIQRPEVLSVGLTLYLILNASTPPSCAIQHTPGTNIAGRTNHQAFIDFRMRRSLAKVVKIRRDRASLPIAAYQEAIVKAVASNPCVLVAGDTGCGKSTQVRRGHVRKVCHRSRSG